MKSCALLAKLSPEIVAYFEAVGSRDAVEQKLQPDCLSGYAPRRYGADPNAHIRAIAEEARKFLDVGDTLKRLELFVLGHSTDGSTSSPETPSPDVAR